MTTFVGGDFDVFNITRLLKQNRPGLVNKTSELSLIHITLAYILTTAAMQRETTV